MASWACDLNQERYTGWRGQTNERVDEIIIYDSMFMYGQEKTRNGNRSQIFIFFNHNPNEEPGGRRSSREKGTATIEKKTNLCIIYTHTHKQKQKI